VTDADDKQAKRALLIVLVDDFSVDRRQIGYGLSPRKGIAQGKEKIGYDSYSHQADEWERSGWTTHRYNDNMPPSLVPLSRLMLMGAGMESQPFRGWKGKGFPACGHEKGCCGGCEAKG
jgi:hypothetical protein